MTDLVERLREVRRGWFLSFENEYTVSLPRANEIVGMVDEAASRISQQDAELERVRRELEAVTAEAFEWRAFFEAEKSKLAEARKAAFIEAAEIAEETAQGSDHLLKAAGQAKDIQAALVHGEGVMTARIIATALRAKAEEPGR